uniref:Lectin, mannose binding 2 like n=1 Tax=Varanus komodoensis TaxID=61221 RepID=A0A8D2JCG7_VARKO
MEAASAAVSGRWAALERSAGPAERKMVAAFPRRGCWSGAELCAVLLLLLALCGARAEQMEEHLKREHSLAKPYQGVGSSTSSLWELMGNAMVMTHFIRLTPDVQSKQGAVWNRVPCYLRDWEMQVHFKIHGQGKKNLNGDGFAMWYTKDRMQPGKRWLCQPSLCHLSHGLLQAGPEQPKI